MNAMGIVFANIYDSSLGQLTNKRTIASLPYGGRYRQIDFTLSNLCNAGIRRVGVITKYNYQSMMNHIGSGQEWGLELEEGGLEYLTPFAMGPSGSYRGKLEALHSALGYLQSAPQREVVLADSNVLCNIDLTQVLQHHRQSGLDVTVVCKSGIANGVKQLDLALRLQEGRVTDLAADYCAGPEYEASMGIFVMGRELLIRWVEESVARSRYRFERDLVLQGFTRGSLTVGAWPFDGVAMFNESPREYFQNNLALITKEIRHDLFRPERTVYTKTRDQVPTYYGKVAEIDNCIVADGCRLYGQAADSVLFRGVTLEPGAKLRGCVIMRDCRLGAGAELTNVILDKNVTVHPGVRLCGTPDNPVIVERGAVI